jgi:hypothetical protein
MKTHTMQTLTIVTAALVVLGGTAPLGAVHADSSTATCKVSKDGDTWQGASGPCTFSQRQGYIDLNLRNGDTYSLTPGSKADHYKDERGNKVVRTRAGGNTEEFKWEGGRKVTVTFASNSGTKHSAPPPYQAGSPAPDLADLVGAKAGQAEGELQRRGYAYKTGSTSGNAKYGAWYNRSTGRCVMIRTEDGRYQSIVQTSPTDCGH